MMGQKNRKNFSSRKFVSAGLLFTTIVLIITAIVIQVFEAIENELFIHIFTVIHIFTGLAFSGLSVLHIKTNWHSMGLNGRIKPLKQGQEITYAALLTLSAILAGLLFVYVFLC